MICDAHIHFFSPGFFAGLGADRTAITAIGWEFPDSTEALSARWIAELDKHGVGKAALMASLAGDAGSVATAVALHPSRFAGFFMLDPTRTDAIDYATHALDQGLRTICLFPAMHRYALHDNRVASVFELAASRRGGTAGPVAVFARCASATRSISMRSH
jgi:predicted TIM-barrel fold metal-dependent hydrolase